MNLENINGLKKLFLKKNRLFLKNISECIVEKVYKQ